jgi:integrase/recombinase XerD
LEKRLIFSTFRFSIIGMKTISIHRKAHRGKDRVFLDFAYDTQLTARVKELSGSTWSRTHGQWHIPYEEGIIGMMLERFQGVAWIDYTAMRTPEFQVLPDSGRRVFAGEKTMLPPLGRDKQEKIITFGQWLKSRRYSARTIQTYTDSLTTFFRYHSNKAVENIDNDDLIEFNNRFILANSYSSSFQNQVVNAVKLFFSTVEMRSLDVDLIHRPKREHILPNVLSKEWKSRNK